MADNRFNNKNHSIQMTLAVNRLYAKLHGYRFFPCNINNLPTGECDQPGWPGCKLYCVRQALKLPNVTSILYLDSDVIVNNVSLQLEDFLQQHLPSNSATTVTREQEDQNHSSRTIMNSTCSSFELIVPGDCRPEYIDTGIQVWHNINDTAFVLLDEWIKRSQRQRWRHFHPFEQGALTQLIFESNFSMVDEARRQKVFIPYLEPNSSVLNVAQLIRIIPFGPSTWHTGRCYISPTRPNYLVHIFTRFKNQRQRVYKEIIHQICQSFSDFEQECNSQLIPLTQVEYQ